MQNKIYKKYKTAKQSKKKKLSLHFIIFTERSEYEQIYHEKDIIWGEY